MKQCPACQGRGWMLLDHRALERCMPRVALAVTVWNVVCYVCDGKRVVPDKLRGDKGAMLN